MPSGKVHTGATVITAVVLSGVGNYLKLPPDINWAIAAGCLSGVFLTPDLDQAEARRGAWGAFWYLYGKAIKHRSFWSHAPIIGTLGRILYLSIYVAIWFFALRGMGVQVEPTINPLIPWCILGLMASDIIHTIFDIFDTRRKEARHD